MASVSDTRGRALRDLRISVTDRCNMRCGYCMPREVFGEGSCSWPRSRAAELRGDRALVRMAAGSACSKLRLTGGEPLLRRGLERAGRDARRHRGDRGHRADHQRRALAGGRRGARRRGPHPRDRQPRRARRAAVRAISDSRSRSRRVLEGSTPPRMRALVPVKVNMVVRRGVNDGAPRDGRAFRRHPRSCASSSSWTWARATAGAPRTWSPRRRSSSASTRAGRWGASHRRRG